MLQGQGGPQGEVFTTTKGPEVELPPAPFKRIDLQHKDNSPGHKRINSATVTGKAAADCTGSDRFPPPPGTNLPPHVLVVSSAPLDFQPTPITNPVFWPGQSIPSFPQDVKGVTLEIQFEGETQVHVTCLSAPGGKQMDSIIVKYDGVQNSKHHLGGSVRYIDGFDPVTQAPIFKTQAIDVLLQ